MHRDATQAPGLRLRSLSADAAWRTAASDAALALLASRLLVLAGGFGAALLFGTSGRSAGFDPGGLAAPGSVLAAPFARWDSVWFLAIAQGGYDDGARAAFFPLYPLVVRLTGGLAGGAIASTLLFGVALTVLHRLVALDLGPRVARGSVLALAFFPMSFFASAVYSEALFLALSVGTFYAARTDRWALAGVLGAGAALTRSAGVVLVVPLAIMAWRRRPPAPLRSAAWIGLVPLGLAAFCLFLWLDSGDPWAPFSAQDVWFRSFAGPYLGVWDGAVAAFQGARQLLSGAREPVYFTAAGGDPFLAARHNIELLVWLVLAVPAIVGCARRLPLAWSAYVVVALALPLSYPVAPQPLMSLPRFLFVLFPLFVWVALWCDGRPLRGRVLLALGAIGLTVYSGIFATWHFVA